MRRIGGGASAGWVLALACNSPESFDCVSNDDCETSLGDGICQPTGWCSFADHDCESGQSYGEHAGDGLANTCVPVADGTTSGPGTTPEPSGSSSGEPPATSSGPGDATGSSTEPLADDTASSSGGDPPCPSGFAECDGDPQTVCESSLAAPQTCGSCDKSCVLMGMTLECMAGTCSGELELLDIEDTYVDELLPMSNFSSAPTLMVDQPPEAQRTLLRAVTLPELPPGANVLSAALRVVIHNEGSNAQLVPITEDWSVDMVTWATQPVADLSAPEPFIADLGPLDIDISPLMDDWLAGGPNHGLMLQALGSNKVEIHSVEYAIEVERPRLVLSLLY